MDDFKSFVYQKFQTFNSTIKAKCAVHFRPKKDWKGKDYGFDWMRLGDTSDFGDAQPYSSIVSKQYHNATTVNNNRNPGSHVGDLVMNGNEYEGNFRINVALYNALKTEYKPLTIPWKTVSSGSFQRLGEYFCSWLSLFPAMVKSKPLPPLKSLEPVDTPTGYTNTEADLRLYLDIAESPDYLEFSENEHFEITPKKITDDLGVGQRFWKSGNTTVKIKCKTDFHVDQMIDVFAVKKDVILGVEERKLAGRLYVWANDVAKRKTCECVLVKIKTPAISSSQRNSGDITNQQDLFEKYLSQALIRMNVITIELNLTSDPNFKKATSGVPEGAYIDGNKINYKKHGVPKPLIEYLEDRLKDKLRSEGKDENLYNGIFKAYYFGEKDVNVNGYLDPVTENVVLFSTKNEQTAVHESLHKFKLAHSFSNKECSSIYIATYTYKALNTENIMDYSHSIGKVRYSLWHWQWEIANKSV